MYAKHVANRRPQQHERFIISSNLDSTRPKSTNQFWRRATVRTTGQSAQRTRHYVERRQGTCIDRVRRGKAIFDRAKPHRHFCERGTIQVRRLNEFRGHPNRYGHLCLHRRVVTFVSSNRTGLFLPPLFRAGRNSSQSTCNSTSESNIEPSTKKNLFKFLRKNGSAARASRVLVLSRFGLHDVRVLYRAQLLAINC